MIHQYKYIYSPISVLYVPIHHVPTNMCLNVLKRGGQSWVLVDVNQTKAVKIIWILTGFQANRGKKKTTILPIKRR